MKHPKSLESFIEERLEYLDKMTMTELAKKAGMSRTALYKLLDNNAEKSQLRTIIYLANALKVHPFVLLRFVFDNAISKNFTEKDAVYSRDASGFVDDITIPDGSVVLANQELVKTWEIVNNGAIDWIDRYFQCVDDKIEVSSSSAEFAAPRSKQGLVPKEPRVLIPLTPPGRSAQITVRLIAPDCPGTYVSYWKMVDAEGNFLQPALEGLFCKVKVLSI